MQQVVTNILRHDGMRYLKVISDAPFDELYPLWKKYVHVIAREIMQRLITEDKDLGIFTMEVTWPMFGSIEVFNKSPKIYRRFIAVNYAYGSKVSECIKLAVDTFIVGTNCFPKLAYVRELPKGAEENMEVHGVTLIESEIAPENCVLVGGMI